MLWAGTLGGSDFALNLVSIRSANSVSNQTCELKVYQYEFRFQPSNGDIQTQCNAKFGVSNYVVKKCSDFVAVLCGAMEPLAD